MNKELVHVVDDNFSKPRFDMTKTQCLLNHETDNSSHR